MVRAAATSHGTFYLYFANKEELFRALATEVVAAMTALGDDFPDLAGPAVEVDAALRAWIVRFADLTERLLLGGPTATQLVETRCDGTGGF